MEIKYAWIKVDGGEVFEGHQLHWANCFFSNAHIDTIREFCELKEFGEVEVTEMTEEQHQKYPELKNFVDKHLTSD